MNEYKKERQEESDGSGGAICPGTARQELAFLYEREMPENLPERRNQPLKAVLVLLLLLAVIIAAVCLLLGMDRDPPQVLFTEEEDVYEGIFESEAAARRCIDASVSLRLGVADELGGGAVSGVIISDDGWILSGAPAFKGERGRIYARLNGGKDVPVDEIRYDDEGCLTLYRISEESLSVAEIGEGDTLMQGEKLIALSSCGAPDYACALISGVMSHPDRSVRIERDGDILRFDGLLQVDLSVGEYGCGAPLFDKKGNLVGISLSGSLNYFTGVEKISSFLGEMN